MGTKFKALQCLVLVLITLADDGEWKKLSPAGTPPIARWGHSAVWDDTSGSMLVFGGTDYVKSKWNDTHRYEVATNEWSTLSPSGSAPTTYLHTAVFDSASRTMLVFNWDGLYRFDVRANAWSSLSPSGSAPAKREGHTAVLDGTTGTMLVFAGYANAYYQNDLHAYSVQANTWSVLSPSGGQPVVRAFHTAVIDVALRAMLVFGGEGWVREGEDHLNDLHRYDVQSNAWSAVSPSGIAPSPRSGHAAVWESTSRAMLVFGGGDGSSSFNDVHKYDVEANAWSALSPAGTLPSVRSFPSSVWDHESRRMLLFGGLGERDDDNLYALEYRTFDAGPLSLSVTDGSSEACAPGRFSVQLVQLVLLAMTPRPAAPLANPH